METLRSASSRTSIAELPEDYRVVGVHGRAPLVRKLTGQVLCIEQDGRLIAATLAAKRRLADRHLAGGVPATSPYPTVWG
jgi:hypothetical protein